MLIRVEDEVSMNLQAIYAALEIIRMCFTIYELVCLTLKHIKNWFDKWNRNNLSQKDRDDIGFTIQEQMNNGEYKTIEGVFNKSTGKVKDGCVYKSEKVDRELARLHRGKQMVIYT